MVDAFSRRILNRRPNIKFVGPRSVDTIPEPGSTIPVEKPARIRKLIKGFENLEKAAVVAEELIAARAKDEVLELNLDLPEDFATAQAAARLFPDNAEEIQPGVSVVKAITFPMYRECMSGLKEHGKGIGKQNQMEPIIPSLKKADFGGINKDRRPELNNMSIMIPPVPIPAFIIATVPLLFAMLFPLISLYTNSKIVGHVHNQSVPPGVPTLPGIPVNPA